ncbi:signal peptidase I [candidate division WWE3 bacterium RIFOXYC1_FULL_39_7]|uniref:Signal peptidase I n=2 Tax=Katanobacteria TaxID=422282 RepID=A0A1F4X8B8_UNCKA|nr:MAG: signal peptidase I [candidate division WWE3 bacterium RIFOXYC1_FULL_39_7]OGC77945.1 MAG: signal peptidase I [candidate division WWE3 bacterium RIFOXYD1_FULL_39_9]
MNSFKHILYELIETLVLSAVVIYLIYSLIASIEVVSGSSMEPNFHTGERILIDKISDNYKPFERGEIVVLTPPGEDGKHFIKRIIGLPGDIIKIVDCHVYISNGTDRFKLIEPYLSPLLCTNGGIAIKEGRSLRIDDGEYLVLGDNRPSSVDSRFFGFIEKKDIIGRVIFRFWPVDKIGFVK